MRQELKAALETSRKHNYHKVTVYLSPSDIDDLKKGAEAIQRTKPPKGCSLSEWDAEIAMIIKAIEAIKRIRIGADYDDDTTQHQCRIEDLRHLQRAAYHADYFSISNLARRMNLSLESLGRDTHPGNLGQLNSYILWLRLEELKATSPYYDDAVEANYKIEKLKREEARLRERRKQLQHELVEINDYLEEVGEPK